MSGAAIRGLLFDLDGTLAVTDPLHYKAWRATLLEHGDELDEAAYQARICGGQNATIVRGFLPALPDGAASALIARLPAPSPGDLFFDIEGDRMGVAEGREFLFGLSWQERKRLAYRGFWAVTEEEERVAFTAVMDFITARLAASPKAHVYHYAPYEPSALKLTVPVLLLQGDADAAVFKSFTDLLDASLKGNGASVDYKIYAGAGHYPLLAAAEPDAVAWLQERLG